MDKQKSSGKLAWGVGAAVCLGVSYWVCRYALFGLHGMKQWPDVLLITGFIVVLISSAAGLRLVAASAALGYPLAFGIAMATATRGIDQGGGSTSNAWIIWGGVYLLCMLLGLLSQLLYRRCKKAK